MSRLIRRKGRYEGEGIRGHDDLTRDEEKKHCKGKKHRGDREDGLRCFHFIPKRLLFVLFYFWSTNNSYIVIS